MWGSVSLVFRLGSQVWSLPSDPFRPGSVRERQTGSVNGQRSKYATQEPIRLPR